MFGLERLLSWRVLALALAETHWTRLQQWEVRAMAAFVYLRLPWYLRPLISEIKLEEAAAKRRECMIAWYEEAQPRSDTLLFGSPGAYLEADGIQSAEGDDKEGGCPMELHDQIVRLENALEHLTSELPERRDEVRAVIAGLAEMFRELAEGNEVARLLLEAEDEGGERY